MRTENEFNRQLSLFFKKQKGLLSRKLSDKYQAGISDFMLIKKGIPVFIECKYKKLYSGAMNHPFSPTQISFLTQVKLAGGRGYGLIGVGDKKLMWLVDADKIPYEGVIQNLAIITNGMPDVFPINEEGVKGMLTYIFGVDNG